MVSNHAQLIRFYRNRISLSRLLFLLLFPLLFLLSIGRHNTPSSPLRFFVSIIILSYHYILCRLLYLLLLVPFGVIFPRHTPCFVHVFFSFCFVLRVQHCDPLIQSSFFSFRFYFSFYSFFPLPDSLFLAFLSFFCSSSFLLNKVVQLYDFYDLNKSIFLIFLTFSI